MALNTGVKTSYTDTTPHVRNVEDLINIISPKDVPLLKVLVGMNEAPDTEPKLDSLSNECFNTKYEWIEDTLAPTSDTLGASVTDTDGTSWTATDGTKFRTGHVVKVDSELVWVSSVSSNTVYVVRAFGGTTGATHSNAATLDIVGVAMLDGADAGTARTTSVAAPYNYTQIFEVPVHISGTQQAIKQYGKKDEFGYQLGKEFANIAILVERALWNGKRAAGSATTARAMGGFDTFITDNVTSLSSAALTEKDINDLLATIFADVGLNMLPQDIFVGQWLKRKISSFYAPYARMDSKERAGGVKVDVIRTEFGDMNVHLGMWQPSNRLYAINLDNVGVGALKDRGFFFEELAKTGDARKGHIVGEYTAEVKNDKSHGMLTTVSITA